MDLILISFIPEQFNVFESEQNLMQAIHMDYILCTKSTFFCNTGKDSITSDWSHNY